MKITNEDKDITIEYNPVGDGQVSRQITFGDGRSQKHTVPAAAAEADLQDLLTNFDYTEVSQTERVNA